MPRPRKPAVCDCGKPAIKRAGNDYICFRCSELEGKRKSMFTLPRHGWNQRPSGGIEVHEWSVAR